MSNKNEKIRSSVGSLNVGYGNVILARRIIAILESKSLPIRRLREKAAGDNRLVDLTNGRKTRSLIVTDSNHVVLSALAPQTLQERLDGSNKQGQALLEFEQGEFIS